MLIWTLLSIFSYFGLNLSLAEFNISMFNWPSPMTVTYKYRFD